MQNELILFFTALIDLFFILLMSRFGRIGLNISIVMNAIAVAVFGGKLIPLFGFATNTGNVFYACIFAAAMILSQYYGKRAAYKSIWAVFFAMAFFTILGQLTIKLSGLTETEGVHRALHIIFSIEPRIALASMAGYLVSQNLNIWLFDYLRHRRWGYNLSARVIASATTGQFIDSIIFFLIAFLGVIAPDVLIQTILVGFFAKVVVAIFSIPFIQWTFRFAKPELSEG